MLIDQWTSLDHHTPGAHWKSREEAEYYSLEMEYTCSTTDLTSLAGCGYSLEWMPFSTGTFEWAVVPAANLAIKKPAMCRDSEFLPDISVAGSCKQLSDTEFQCPSGCEYVKHERHWSCECQVTWIEECAQKLPGAQIRQKRFCRDLSAWLGDLTCENEGKAYLDQFAPLCCSDGKRACDDKYTVVSTGSPLIVPWDDAAAGYALLGLQTSQPVAGPAAFLRASELLPWILSVPRLGKNPPTVMSLEMKDIDIPDGVTVAVHKDWDLVDNVTSCDVSDQGPKVFYDPNQAIMIRVSKEGCKNGCAANVNIDAAVRMLDCSEALMETGSCPAGCLQDGGRCENPKCKISMSWEELMELNIIGKAYSGGLGRSATKNREGDFQMWACVRDWDWTEMRSCGVGLGQFACFKFDERSREFVYWDTAKKLKLISPEKLLASFDTEDANTDHTTKPRGKHGKTAECHDASKCMHESCRAWAGSAQCTDGYELHEEMNCLDDIGDGACPYSCCPPPPTIEDLFKSGVCPVWQSHYLAGDYEKEPLEQVVTDRTCAEVAENMECVNVVKVLQECSNWQIACPMVPISCVYPAPES
jgi:hypothetical protein